MRWPGWSFPGRALLIAVVVGLLVVPLQMSLIPLLKLYNGVGTFFGVPAKTYLGIWLAHTGFGLPLAIYLLRNYMAGLPREIDGIGARRRRQRLRDLRQDHPAAVVPGAGLLRDLPVPLGLERPAGRAWSSSARRTRLVLTGRLQPCSARRGGNWEILTASAFITIIVPLIVFFSLQRYFVRGLLAGSVKGG